MPAMQGLKRNYRPARIAIGWVWLGCVAAVAVAVGGCQRPGIPTENRELTAEEYRFEAAWRASMDVLREYRFEVDWSDRRSGTIETKRMTSMYPAEFWRKDVTTSDQLAESALHTFYRTARVEISPAEGDEAGYQALVRVEVSRSDRPVPAVTSTSQARDLYTGRAERELRAYPVQDVAGDLPARPTRVASVAPLGRDNALEARLAADIAARMSQLLAAR